MSELRDLLIEIGTEELPPGSLRRLAEAFANEVHLGLERHNLKHTSQHWYATPRRLAALIKNLAVEQEDREEIRRGPALAAAYDEAGKPTRAAEGFAKSCHTRVSDLETLETDKGSWLVYRLALKGKSTASLLPEIIETALSRLPIARRMRWGDFEVEFVRPVHWSVVLFGNETIKCPLLGTVSGNETRGHRFLNPKPIKLKSPSEYPAQLRTKGFVIADFEKRKQQIEKAVTRAAEKLEGRALIDANLLEEVTSLVEWPVVINGTFDKKFLELPREVLVASMQDHQKYFPVTGKSGRKLLNYFITVMNIKSRSPREVIRGNERVIRPRLADADFFWRRDLGRKLEELIPGLKDVVFEKELGTLHDKTERIKRLAGYIADRLGADKKLAERAAALCKCDLFTEMVGEFPELQGTMGRYYALKNGEDPEVALALDEQYMPRYAGDRLPGTATGRIIALADKLDTLLGIFCIGQTPTGDKDPYGLRRSALGCLRIMIECELDLDLAECLAQAARGFSDRPDAANSVPAVFDFMMERLRRYYLDEGIRPDVFDAVLECRPVSPHDFHKRIHAVTAFTRLAEADSLAAANKRIQNILRQAGNGDPDSIAPAVDASLFTESAEKDLAKKLADAARKAQPLAATGKYTEVLKELSKLRNTVDTFFDKVMVMVEDNMLRRARLQLLAQIRHEFRQVADISRLQG